MVELLSVVAIIGILAAIAIPNFLEAQTRSKTSRARMELTGLRLALGDYFTDWGNYPPPLVIPDIEETARQRLEENAAAANRSPFTPASPFFRQYVQMMGSPMASQGGQVSNATPGGATSGALPTSATGVPGAATPTTASVPPPGIRGSPWSARRPIQPAPVSQDAWEMNPSPLIALTTPIAYVPMLPIDPFHRSYSWGASSVNIPYKYQPHMANDGEGLRIDVPGHKGNFLFTLWSYGPDMAGDTAFAEEIYSVILYDPSNGTTSRGDIVVSGP